MFRIKKTLRFQLLMMYIFTISVPVVIIAVIAPFYYQKAISDRTEGLTKSIIGLSRSNLNTYFDEMERLTQSPYFNSDAITALSFRSTGQYDKASSYQKLVAERAINNLMERYYQNSDEHVAGVLIVSTDGYSYSWSSYGSSDLKNNFNIKNESWFQQTLKSDGRPVYIGAHKQDYLIHSDAGTVFSVARLIKDPATMRPIAVIMVDSDTQVIDNVLKNAKFDVTSIVSIFDEKGKTIFSTEALPDSIQSQALKNDSIVRFKNAEYKVVSSGFLISNWKIVVMFSLSDINDKVRLMYVMGTLFAVAGLLITLLLFVQYSKRITLPYRKMIGAMNEVEKGNLAVRFSVKGEDEVAQLSREFNNMLIRIDDLVNREYKATLSQKTAEYNALQSQIKPHFLFNTLNGFIALNRLNDRQTLETSILSLTGMMRYILEYSDMAEVRDELKFLEEYCQLQQLRFKNRLCYHIGCDESLLPFQVPKLLLQPLVENAIIHGIEPSNRMCHLEIMGEVHTEEGRSVILFSVQDDGVGFDYGSKTKQTSRGIGNIRERLEIAYKDAALLSVVSTPGGGTKAVIRIWGENLV